jgi:hypothetical protein
MVGATVSGVTVCCPECGGPLRVSFADGGSIVGCHRCGEAVRVPARPHPVETPDEAPSPIPLLAARQAARGVRLLQASLALFALEHVLLAGVVVGLVSVSGPAGLFSPAPGWWLGLVLGIDLGLVFARTVVRWAGYRRCEPAAAAVGAAGFLRWARWAPVLRLAGYLGVVLPWALGLRPAELRTVAPLAVLAWSVGGVLEFVAVAAWGRLLAALGDRDSATRTARYAVLVGVLVAAVAVGLMLVRVTAVVLSRRAGAGNPSADWSDLPADAWPVVAGLAVVAAALTAVAWASYARILTVLRARLREV